MALYRVAIARAYFKPLDIRHGRRAAWHATATRAPMAATRFAGRRTIISLRRLARYRKAATPRQ